MHGHGHGMHGHGMHGQNPDVYGTPPQPQEPLQHGGCLVYILPCYAKISLNLFFSIVMSSQKLLELAIRIWIAATVSFVCGMSFWVQPDTSVIFDRTKDRKGPFLPKPWHGFQGTFDLQYRSNTYNQYYNECCLCSMPDIIDCKVVVTSNWLSANYQYFLIISGP